MVYIDIKWEKASGLPTRLSDRVERLLIKNLRESSLNFSGSLGLGETILKWSKQVEKLVEGMRFE